MTTSDRIELLRKKKGMSLVYLNNAIGAYRGKITEVRKGKASFDDEEISILAQALSTSSAYLLGQTDDPSPDGEKEKPAPNTVSGPAYPPEYDFLSPEDKELVDNMIRSLAKKKSSG